MSRVTVVCLFIVFGIFLNSCGCHGRKLTKCGLTNKLINLNFPRTFIGNWVCLIESESAKNTSAITNRANGKKGVGLFQIRSKDWCTFGRKGGICNVKCEDMVDENIADDGICAQKIQEQMGFLAWDGWKRSCKGRTLPIPTC